MDKKESFKQGFTVIELLIATAILAMISLSVLQLYSSMVNSAFIAKRKAVASSLATNQMEYLKGLPYNSLAVAGGSIIATSYLPASTTSTVNNVNYTVKTSINYADDAFDGCGSYPTPELKAKYCLNQPAPTGSPTDSNPADYKSINVTVYSATNLKLAEVDTKVSARVAETASNTGAIFVKVIDNAGNPLSGALVNIVNNTLSPNVNASDSTDSNGTAVFYGLPPDSTGYDYVVTGTLSGYSSLTTKGPSGALQATYPSLQLLTQSSSYTTLTLKPQGQYSLIGEVTDLNGNPINNARISIKGGYKNYTSTSDTTYYYNNMSPSDVRPTTGANGLFTLQNLVPGEYIFCGDSGATDCRVGSTTYYLAAAVPYGGNDPLMPINVPIYDASSPPTITFSDGSNNYLQKVRLMLTTSSSFPRVQKISPGVESLTSGTLSNFEFSIKGVNIPCGAVPASCSTSVRFQQSSSTYTASCTGDGTSTLLNCSVNLSGVSLGNTQLIVQVGSNTLTLPAAPMLGGVVIEP